MTPLNPQSRQSILDQASKAFAGQTPADLETEMDEYEELLSSRFTVECGLSAERHSRLRVLADKFQPFIK